MDVPGYDSLLHYTSPPNNYIGATIFLSYILAALYATTTIAYSLYSRYITIFGSTTKDEKLNATRSARARHIKIYAFLASISFATLSYNMLSFLISHYMQWNGDKSFSPSAISPEKLKRWMLNSSLFQDFAHDLVKDAPNTVWTQAAIIATWFWNIWIAQKARRRRIDTQTMRTFILLSQILPISFTAALFIIELHLSSPDIQSTTPNSDIGKDNASSPPQRLKPKASLQLPNILLNASLLALPSLRSHPIFSTLVLFERAILLLPHFSLLSLRDEEVVKCITVAGGFVVANAAMARKELNLKDVLSAFGGGGYAVKALGWDALLGLLV
ncbi:hypothetical protein BKA66DRAFT_394193, partial [Pyrenochaeta sp. MPI-SDFR-AT-0127]